MAVHLTNHEHHRERLPRTLRMPDDAAAFTGVLAVKQALHRQLHRSELLVAADYPDRLALVVGGEESEGADQVE